MNRRGASVARPADGGRAFNWAALASDSDSDSVSSVPATPVAVPPKSQGKKVMVTPGAPRKASKMTRVEELLMDAAAFPEATLYGPLPAKQKGSVVVKEVYKKGGVCVMDVCCPLPAVAAPAETLLSAIMARGGLIDGDPEMAALDMPGACWGDLFMGPVQSVEPSTERQLRGTEAEFWAQPFAANLTVYTMDVYDTRSLTDDEWTAMMTWLYWNGWWVDNSSREWVSAEPDDLPARYWCPPRPEEEEPVCAGPCRHWSADEPAAAEPSAPKAPKKKALRAAGLAPVPVKRFCRAVGVCTEAGCRYVHEDTIPKIDRPCGFGAECGASDPTGVKRSQCLYMHPGETWTADLCIHRPSL